jgi:hypothetical protein
LTDRDLPEEFRRQRSEITARVSLRRGKRRLSDGETWIDHQCLFHDDAHQSASWQEVTGVYFCRAESKVFVVPLVLDALNVVTSTAPRGGGHSGPLAPGSARRQAAASTSEPSPRVPRDKRFAIAYNYRFPDGRPSHTKFRQGDGAAKQIWQEGPAGEPSLPEQIYPIFGDWNLGPDGHLLVVEGEKCVEIVLDVDEEYDAKPIRAITCGSTADLQKHAALLVARLRDLHPASVTLWPDYDQPGLKAMAHLSQQLLAASIPHRVIAPEDLGLSAKGDVVDYIMAGGKLAEVIRKGLLPHLNGDADGIVSRAIVTRDGRVVFPGTRNLISITIANANAIWYQEAHGMPKDTQSKELAARLQVKSHAMGVEVSSRQFNLPTQTWWRPRSTGPALRISANGVELADDPEGYFLSTPADILDYPVDVDLDGSRDDLEELAASFHLSEHELIMCEGWLICALAGLQTPILFMRAPAGTGKTTLARLLLSIIEPLCPELDLSKRQNQDMRELIHALRTTQALLIDNVSKLDSGLEDQLAKLVTGYSTTLRTLYTDATDVIRLRRALIITTTSYDVYKGDLAQRMIVAQPTTEQQFRWLPDSIARERFARFIPRIRGYIFGRLAEFYKQRPGLDVDAIRFRIGDLGLVLAALGYDTAELARREAASKSEIIAQDDPWLEALVAMWKDEDSEMFFKPTADILKWMRDYGIHELPPEKSPRLARYLSEKNPIFADHGFTTEKLNKAQVRGYRFIRSGGVQDVIPELDLAVERDQE